VRLYNYKVLESEAPVAATEKPALPRFTFALKDRPGQAGEAGHAGEAGQAPVAATERPALPRFTFALRDRPGQAGEAGHAGQPPVAQPSERPSFPATESSALLHFTYGLKDPAGMQGSASTKSYPDSTQLAELSSSASERSEDHGNKHSSYYSYRSQQPESTRKPQVSTLADEPRPHYSYGLMPVPASHVQLTRCPSNESFLMSTCQFTRVARFFLVQNTKTGKNAPNHPKNIPNGHKIFPMVMTKWS
jgi:hypothetical protein